MQYSQPRKYYDTRNLSEEEAKELFKKAYRLCYEWWVDKLDTSTSFARQRVVMSFNEALDKFNEHSLVTIIHRPEFGNIEPEHIEVGFRRMGIDVDYFLWILVPIDKHEYFASYLQKGA